MALIAVVQACSTDTLLEAEDPDLIMPSNTNSLPGAIAVANGTLGRLRSVTAGQESSWMFGGLLVDEYGTSSTFIQNDETDWRLIQLNNSSITGMFRRLAQVRTAANQAIPLLKQFQPTGTALIGEMYFARGFAELQLASDFCNGIPLSNGVDGNNIVFGDPLPVAQVFAAAVASFDTALATATGTDAQSINIQNAAKVGRGRALLGLGQFDNASAAVAGVPNSFSYNTTFSLTTTDNIIWNQGFSAKRYNIADSTEGNNRDLLVRNAIPFSRAADPRLPVRDSKFVGTATVGQDGGTIMRTTTRFGRLTTISVVNGLDARLIEAEAFLKGTTPNPTQWLATLNALRTGANRITAVDSVTLGAADLPALADPGTPDGRINLMFREKAFWTFGHGQRLGDLRRLVRQYGRAAANVFPEGPHYKTSAYGPDTNLPVVTDEQNNPKFTACLDRNP